MKSKPNIFSTFTILILVLAFVVFACRENESTQQVEKPTPTIQSTINLVIGAEDQPLDHQLGQPEAVRSDNDGNIYIADRQSMQIKVFDRDGSYLKSLGGRGRGPGEFQGMELMEWTPEGHLVVMDRGNMRFTIISTEGTEIESFPYNLSDQFYPKAIRYVDDTILALFYNSSSRYEVPNLERDILHIYSTDFQQRQASFTPVKNLGFDDMFELRLHAFHPGNLALSEDENTFIYSPSTYKGTLRMYHKQKSGEWKFAKTLQGKEPQRTPYELYSEEQYRKADDNNLARATSIWYGGEVFRGRQLSMDAGIFYLDDGRIVQFYATLRKDYLPNPDSQNHPLDLYVQIFDQNGILRNHSFLFEFNAFESTPYFSVVNWKDSEESFYLIDYPNEFPTIKRFSLEL